MDTATAPEWMIRLSDVCDYWSDAAERGAREALTRFADDLPDDHLEAIRQISQKADVCGVGRGSGCRVTTNLRSAAATGGSRREVIGLVKLIAYRVGHR